MRPLLILLVSLSLLALACDDDDDSNGIMPPPPSEVGLRLSPTAVSAGAGEEFEVSVLLEKSAEVFGVTFDVIFEAPRVSVVADSISFGDLFGDTPLTLAVVETGRLSLGASLTQADGVDAVVGSGTVATVRFTSLGAEPSQIRVESVVAVTETGAPTPVAVLGGTAVN
jgi:hypothetical protein